MVIQSIQSRRPIIYWLPWLLNSYGSMKQDITEGLYILSIAKEIKDTLNEFYSDKKNVARIHELRSEYQTIDKEKNLWQNTTLS